MFFSRSSRLPCLAGKNGFRQFQRSLTSNINVKSLTPAIQKFVDDNVRLCRPDNVYVCDGSERENQAFVTRLIRDGRLTKLDKYENWSAYFSSIRREIFSIP